MSPPFWTTIIQTGLFALVLPVSRLLSADQRFASKRPDGHIF
ncbi:hypothetical protein [Spirosoma panaciterrae]|nr:hypothetical protein [Spirosoma panaciterrae]